MSYLLKNEIQNIYVKSESVSSQLLSTTYQTLNGSSVIYTPHPQAKNVIYEYTFGYSWYPDAKTILQISIQQETSGTYSSLGNEWRRIAPSFSESATGAVTCNMFWVLDPWTGPKGIRLRSRSYSAAHEATAHITRHYHQSVVSKEFFPVLKVYSVIGD